MKMSWFKLTVFVAFFEWLRFELGFSSVTTVVLVAWCFWLIAEMVVLVYTHFRENAQMKSRRPK